MNARSRYLGIAAVVLLGLVLGGVVFLRWNLAPVKGQVQITYSSLAASDEGLSAALQERNGLKNVSTSRGSNFLTIYFSADAPLTPSAFLDIAKECDQRGYTGRLQYKGEFADRRQHGTHRQTFWVEYVERPADDSAISAWLAAQPGVIQPAVWRTDRFVVFEMELANPPPPSIYGGILQKCEQSGYQHRAGFIHALGTYR